MSGTLSSLEQGPSLADCYYMTDDKCMELLTSMIRRTTAEQMESNCMLEMVPGNPFVVHNSGITSRSMGWRGLHYWIKSIYANSGPLI